MNTIHRYTAALLIAVLPTAFLACGGAKTTQEDPPPPAPAPVKREPPISFVGSYIAKSPNEYRPDMQMILYLNADGSAIFSHDFFDDESPIIEVGTWRDNGDRTATVRLTGQQQRADYVSPDIITFRLIEDELIAVKYNIDLYGYRGLRLRKRSGLPRSPKTANQSPGKAAFGKPLHGQATRPAPGKRREQPR